MSKYFYARVSTKEQSLARQLETAAQFGIDADHIFTDKATGKTFDRPGYQAMKNVILPGDELFVHDLDRLGRNKDAQKDELRWFKDNGIIVRIQTIPTTLIDFQGQDWIGDMVTNLLIEVMSSVAEQERIKILQRQREGIDAMPVDDSGYKVSPKTGNRFGRKGLDKPEGTDLVIRSYLAGEINLVDACHTLNIGTSRMYRYLREYKSDVSTATVLN